VEKKVIAKSGNSYTFTTDKGEEVKLGVGRETAKQTLRGDRPLIEKIRKQIIKVIAEEKISMKKEDDDAE
jgi:hypothetical protein